MTTTSGPADEEFRDDDAINAALQTAVESGEIELRPLESLRRGNANVQRILARENVRRRLREAYRQKGFRPVTAALYVEDLAELAGVTISEVIQALDLPETDGLAVLDQPSNASVEAQVRLGIDDQHWDKHLKLAELKRIAPTMLVVALRQLSSGKATSSEECLQWVEDQIAEAMTIGGDAVRNGLAHCEAEIQRLRAALHPQ